MEIALLATPVISGILLTIGLLGLLLEMQTMHGIAGTVGIVALALFFGSHIAAGDTGIWVVLLAVLGLAGIVFELHLVPGHGAPGILGSIALLAAMLLSFGPVGAAAFFVAMQTVAAAIVATVILFSLATRAVPENAWMARLTFSGAQGADYVASSDLRSLTGKTGTASSFLRPAGVALIDGHRVDVLTQGEFIPEGTPVRVTRVQGSRVFVEPLALPTYKE